MLAMLIIAVEVRRGVWVVVMREERVIVLVSIVAFMSVELFIVVIGHVLLKVGITINVLILVPQLIWSNAFVVTGGAGGSASVPVV